MCERQQHAQQLQQRLGAEEANHALALVRSMEKPLCETVAKIEGLASELGEVHTKLGAHDEQQRVLRTIVEGCSESLRSQGERLERGNWDRRLDLLQQSLQEESKRRTEHLERVEVMAKRAEFHEQSLEELRGELWESSRRLRSGSMCMPSDGSSKGLNGTQVEALREEMRPGRPTALAPGAAATGDVHDECLSRGGCHALNPQQQHLATLGA